MTKILEKLADYKVLLLYRKLKKSTSVHFFAKDSVNGTRNGKVHRNGRVSRKTV